MYLVEIPRLEVSDYFIFGVINFVSVKISVILSELNQLFFKAKVGIH
jgi:hypothetical protein